MINIDEKQNCCGCGACAQKCPKKCIIMQEDEEGFLYPLVLNENCVQCGICEKVCPVANANETREPTLILAAQNRNEQERLKSSSGGVFTAMSEYVIEKGGVVFGAKFDENWNVIHGFTDTMTGVSDFRGSKYVQSVIADSFVDVEKHLKEGRYVLFSGTPCQVAGLKKYLGRDYDNLLCVEIICHGVPSPLVWRQYIKYIQSIDLEKNCRLRQINGEEPKITSISFRDKSNGWKQYSFVVEKQDGCENQKGSSDSYDDSMFFVKELASKNLFMKGFLKNVYLRPSCYNCPVREGRSMCDIAIGDYWGMPEKFKEFDDDKGTSLVFAYTKKGQDVIENLPIENRPTTFEDAIRRNSCYFRSVPEPKQRKWFWNHFNGKNLEIIAKACEDDNLSFFKRTFKFAKKKIAVLLKF